MKSNLESIKVGLLAIISVCIIILVIQGFSKTGTQDVYVRGGRIDADAYVNGGEIDVNVDKVMGYPVGCHKSYTVDGKAYHAIDVYNRSY